MCWLDFTRVPPFPILWWRRRGCLCHALTFSFSPGQEHMSARAHTCTHAYIHMCTLACPPPLVTRSMLLLACPSSQPSAPPQGCCLLRGCQHLGQMAHPPADGIETQARAHLSAACAVTAAQNCIVHKESPHSAPNPIPATCAPGLLA